MSQLREKYEQLISIEKEVERLKKEVADLKRATFGEVSAEEDVAKRFFSELAESSEEIRNAEKEFQEKQDSLEKLMEELKNAEQDFLRTLTDVKFPLKIGAEGIEVREKEVIFHFDTEIEKAILDKIVRFLGPESLSSGNVEIQTSGIVVRDSQQVTDAMKAVMSHVENKIRKAAMKMLEVDKYVTELRSRDHKIQRMLYVLFEAGDKALSKKEIEIKSNLEKGALRGVLYVVLNRDQYLKKVETGKYTLTEIGKRVMQRYVQRYGSPIEERKGTTKTLPNYQDLSSNEG